MIKKMRITIFIILIVIICNPIQLYAYELIDDGKLEEEGTTHWQAHLTAQVRMVKYWSGYRAWSLWINDERVYRK